MNPAIWILDNDTGDWHRIAYKSHITVDDLKRFAALSVSIGVPAYAEGDEAGELAAKHGVSRDYVDMNLYQ